MKILFVPFIEFKTRESNQNHSKEIFLKFNLYLFLAIHYLLFISDTNESPFQISSLLKSAETNPTLFNTCKESSTLVQSTGKPADAAYLRIDMCYHPRMDRKKRLTEHYSTISLHLLSYDDEMQRFDP